MVLSTESCSSSQLIEDESNVNVLQNQETPLVQVEDGNMMLAQDPNSSCGLILDESDVSMFM